MKTRLMIFMGVAGLIAVALFAAGMLAGNSLAQDGGEQPAQPAEGEPAENNVIIKEIEVVGGAGIGFPFESALREMAANGQLSHEDVDAIMSDLSELTEAVHYESSTSEDGLEHEVNIDITIDSSELEFLRQAMETALDNAVSDGRLTSEQAEAVLAEVDAAPDPLAVAADGIVHIEAFGDHAGLDFTAPLQARLDKAVAEGTVSEAEAETFLDLLERLLGE